MVLALHLLVEEGTPKHPGFIAEELDALGLTPFLVYEEDGVTPFTINYEFLNFVLVSLLQQEHQRINHIEERLGALEGAAE